MMLLPSNAEPQWDMQDYSWDGIQMTAVATTGQDGGCKMESGNSAQLAGAHASSHQKSGQKKSPFRPKCQVASCGVDLANSRAYYRRYRICEQHFRLPSMFIDGQEVRFCQQCAKFESITEFEGNKRSCRRQLNRHNERRNVRKANRQGKKAMGEGEYGCDNSDDDSSSAPHTKQYNGKPDHLGGPDGNALADLLRSSSFNGSFTGRAGDVFNRTSDTTSLHAQAQVQGAAPGYPLTALQQHMLMSANVAGNVASLQRCESNTPVFTAFQGSQSDNMHGSLSMTAAACGTIAVPPPTAATQQLLPQLLPKGSGKLNLVSVPPCEVPLVAGSPLHCLSHVTVEHQDGAASGTPPGQQQETNSGPQVMPATREDAAADDLLDICLRDAARELMSHWQEDGGMDRSPGDTTCDPSDHDLFACMKDDDMDLQGTVGGDNMTGHGSSTPMMMGTPATAAGAAARAHYGGVSGVVSGAAHDPMSANSSVHGGQQNKEAAVNPQLLELLSQSHRFEAVRADHTPLVQGPGSAGSLGNALGNQGVPNDVAMCIAQAAHHAQSMVHSGSVAGLDSLANVKGQCGQLSAPNMLHRTQTGALFYGSSTATPAPVPVPASNAHNMQFGGMAGHMHPQADGVPAHWRMPDAMTRGTQQDAQQAHAAPPAAAGGGGAQSVPLHPLLANLQPVSLVRHNLLQHSHSPPNASGMLGAAMVGRQAGNAMHQQGSNPAANIASMWQSAQQQQQPPAHVGVANAHGAMMSSMFMEAAVHGPGVLASSQVFGNTNNMSNVDTSANLGQKLGQASYLVTDSLTRLTIKLHGVTPDVLPLDLRAALTEWLSSTDSRLLQGFIRPGCVALTLDCYAPGARSSAAVSISPQVDASLQLQLQQGTNVHNGKMLHGAAMFRNLDEMLQFGLGSHATSLPPVLASMFRSCSMVEVQSSNRLVLMEGAAVWSNTPLDRRPHLPTLTATQPFVILAGSSATQTLLVAGENLEGSGARAASAAGMPSGSGNATAMSAPNILVRSQGEFLNTSVEPDLDNTQEHVGDGNARLNASRWKVTVDASKLQPGLAVVECQAGRLLSNGRSVLIVDDAGVYYEMQQLQAVQAALPDRVNSIITDLAMLLQLRTLHMEDMTAAEEQLRAAYHSRAAMAQHAQHDDVAEDDDEDESDVDDDDAVSIPSIDDDVDDDNLTAPSVSDFEEDDYDFDQVDHQLHPEATLNSDEDEDMHMSTGMNIPNVKHEESEQHNHMRNARSTVHTQHGQHVAARPPAAPAAPTAAMNVVGVRRAGMRGGRMMSWESEAFGDVGTPRTMMQYSSWGSTHTQPMLSTFVERDEDVDAVHAAQMQPGRLMRTAPCRAAVFNASVRADLVMKGLRLLAFAADAGWPSTTRMLLELLTSVPFKACNAKSAALVPLTAQDVLQCVVGDDGLTVLHRAARSDSVATMREILMFARVAGVKVNLAACGGAAMSPMHIAACSARGGALSLLMLDAYPDGPVQWFVSRDSRGRTAAQCAQQAGGCGVAVTHRARLLVKALAAA